MRFDDRLMTVMNRPIADSRDQLVRWRQLVDILSRDDGEGDAELVAAAYAMVRNDAGHISTDVKAATARQIAGRDLPVRLVAIFAGMPLRASAPVLTSALLDDAEWDIVEASATDESRRLIDTFRRRPKVETAQVAEAIPAERDPASPVDEQPSISEMVDRIEQLRTLRGSNRIAASWEEETVPPSVDEVTEEDDLAHPAEPASGELADDGVIEASPPPVQAEHISAFRWECDAEGAIDWVEGAPRGALIGRQLLAIGEGSGARPSPVLDHEPFDGHVVTVDAAAIGGAWSLSGIPAFSPQDGRFLGYRGIARRADETDGPNAEGTAVGRAMPAQDLDSLRETVHELRTPLNAIIGFAEIIDGQYFGPAHRSYRRRAADIVGQARTLLAAIEDMDMAARLSADTAGAGKLTRLGDILPELMPTLEQHAAAKGARLHFMPHDVGQRCAISKDVATRLLQRFLLPVVAAAGFDETIAIRMSTEGQKCVVSISRPIATLNVSVEQLLDPSYRLPGEQDDALLGLGFALRMVRGLARMIGGDLLVGPEMFQLVVPIAKR